VATETRKALEATDPGYSSEIEHKVVFGDGQPGYLAVRIFLVKDDQGRTVGTYGVNQDVTDRRAAEEALRASEERLRGVFQAAVDGILVANVETGRFVMANQTICRMLGYPEEELLRLGVEDIHPPEALPLVMEAFEKQVAGLDPLSSDVPVRRKDGTTFVADINAVPLVMGGRSCLLGVFRDMTAVKELEAQVRQAQKMEAVGRLAGGVAHDFNNVLGVILGHCELALKRLRRDDPLTNNLEQMLDSAERGAALTRQLLAFSRQQALSPAYLDLSAVVHDLARMLERLLGEDIELELSLAEDRAPVHADPGQIEQVIINLAVNARDAMPGGGRLLIATSRHAAASGSPEIVGDGPARATVVLTVTDTGCGMDETTKQHLFEPFFTTKEMGKGTGLGLSTVYGIVEQAAGRIEFESELGRGTTFRVILPSAERATATEPTPTRRQAEEGRGETILVVEDEEGLRTLVQDLLQDLGYTPVVAANGGEALLAVEEQHLRPEVLITDVVMPGMSGTTLADRLRRTLPDLKVLFMSGYSDVEDRADEAHGGLQNLLHKPFHAADLARAVDDVLRDGSGDQTG
jgi:PAS domain S-box-containing protein